MRAIARLATVSCMLHDSYATAALITDLRHCSAELEIGGADTIAGRLKLTWEECGPHPHGAQAALAYAMWPERADERGRRASRQHLSAVLQGRSDYNVEEDAARRAIDHLRHLRLRVGWLIRGHVRYAPESVQRHLQEACRVAYICRDVADALQVVEIERGNLRYEAQIQSAVRAALRGAGVPAAKFPSAIAAAMREMDLSEEDVHEPPTDKICDELLADARLRAGVPHPSIPARRWVEAICWLVEHGSDEWLASWIVPSLPSTIADDDDPLLPPQPPTKKQLLAFGRHFAKEYEAVLQKMSPNVAVELPAHVWLAVRTAVENALPLGRLPPQLRDRLMAIPGLTWRSGSPVVHGDDDAGE